MILMFLMKNLEEQSRCLYYYLYSKWGAQSPWPVSYCCVRGSPKANTGPKAVNTGYFFHLPWLWCSAAVRTIFFLNFIIISMRLFCPVTLADSSGFHSAEEDLLFFWLRCWGLWSSPPCANMSYNLAPLCDARQLRVAGPEIAHPSCS